ncbi:VgrG-related protein [bacterium]|nr:VgrG-related protein [bacterium]
METLLIKFNGVPDPLLTADILEVIVDTHAYLPDMFTIVIEDEIDIALGTLKYGDNALKFRLGTAVDIVMETMGIDSPVPLINTLISGEITGVEPVFKENGHAILKIRGYDLSHRLTYGKKTRTFGDGNPLAPTVSDQQIVSAIASEYGLIPKVQASSLMYNYVMQYNQSDWDFLWSRAELLGYQLYTSGKFLHFEKSSSSRHLLSADDLVWGRNLKRFEPRLVSAGTVIKAEAIGWDPDKKAKVAGNSGLKTINKFVKTADAGIGSGMALKSGYGITPEDTLTDHVVRSNSEAKTYASSVAESRESQFVKASGELSIGDPFLLAGTEVTVTNVGVRFAGKYYVTEATHIYRSGVYTVQFQISGKNPYTFRNLLLGNERPSNKIDGVVIGIVTDINDPQQLGRVKVKYPWMPEYRSAELESSWARLAITGGGKNRGIYFLPEINDEVLVAFERGDMNYPYIVGALWNKKDAPPEGKPLAPNKKEVAERIIRSASGHIIVLDDTSGSEKILIQDKTKKNSITIDSKTNAMTIKTEGDFTIEAGGKFIVKSTQDMNLETKGKASLASTSNLQLESKAGAKMKAGTSEVDLQMAGASLKGTKVDVQSNTATSVKGNAMVEIQGGIVKIN